MSEGTFQSNADMQDPQDQREQMTQAQDQVNFGGGSEFNGIGQNGSSDLGKNQTVNAGVTGGSGSGGDLAGSAAGATSGSDMAQSVPGYGSSGEDDEAEEGQEADEPDSPAMFGGSQSATGEESSDNEQGLDEDMDDGASAASAAGPM